MFIAKKNILSESYQTVIRVSNCIAIPVKWHLFFSLIYSIVTYTQLHLVKLTLTPHTYRRAPSLWGRNLC